MLEGYGKKIEETDECSGRDDRVYWRRTAFTAPHLLAQIFEGGCFRLYVPNLSLPQRAVRAAYRHAGLMNGQQGST